MSLRESRCDASAKWVCDICGRGSTEVFPNKAMAARDEQRHMTKFHAETHETTP